MTSPSRTVTNLTAHPIVLPGHGRLPAGQTAETTTSDQLNELIACGALKAAPLPSTDSQAEERPGATQEEA